jgi:hypothetical protein
VRFALTIVSYFLPDVRPVCDTVANPGTNRAKGFTSGFKNRICARSSQTGMSIGTPGALLGWSEAIAGP